MSNGIKLCRSCMNSVPVDATRCPNCGYNGQQQNASGSLPIGYRLNARYVVGMRKGEDGDSMNYIGFDCTLNKPVEIREFMPHNGCVRNPESFELRPNPGAELHYKTSLMDFCELYKNLRKIEGNPGIIRTFDFFEANMTAYAVLDVFDGIPLREFLSMAGGSISCEQATKLLEPVFGAVESIHAVNLIHRGISPDTIFVNRNGDVRLGGFATSQVRTRGTEVANKLFGGYAAPEQYSTTMFQSAATDVYALAAVFYRCVSGITPQDAEQRRGYDTLEPLAKLSAGFPPAISRAIAVSMLINAQERTQYVPELVNMLKNPDWAQGQPAAGADTDTEDDEQPRARKQEKKKSKYPAWIESIGVRNFWIILSAFLLIFLAVGGYFIAQSINQQQPEEEVVEIETVTVPNYVNLQYPEEFVPDNDKFKYEYEDAFEEGVEEGVIVQQSPAAETIIELDPTAQDPRPVIKLYINRGKRVEMPDLKGKTLEAAISELEKAGINYVVVEEVTDAYGPGIIISQSIKAGEKVDPEKQTVRLTVSKAKEEPKPETPETPATDPNTSGGDSGGDSGGETTSGA